MTVGVPSHPQRNEKIGQGEERLVRHFSKISLFAHVTTLVKLIYTPAAVYQLLLTGKERMTLGANIYTKLAVAVSLCRTSRKGLTAGTAHLYFLVIGMDSSFHDFTSFHANNIRYSANYIISGSELQ